MFLASVASCNLTNPQQMTFPLFFSGTNSSRHRRELGRTSSARMRLHDDHFTEGYYSTRLYIGTPPQEFSLIVDTGSSVTYFPCITCKNCGNNHQIIKKLHSPKQITGLDPGMFVILVSEGEFSIAFIRFDIYLSMNYSDLVPIVSELSDAMSQIELSSFKSEGNGSVIRWIIFPEAFTDCISNKTAMVIISHLTGDSFHLPEKFGSFKLIDLKLEPLLRRTWWQGHSVVLILRASAVAILASSIFLVSYWYRRKHGCSCSCEGSSTPMSFEA